MVFVKLVSIPLDPTIASVLLKSFGVDSTFKQRDEGAGQHSSRFVTKDQRTGRFSGSARICFCRTRFSSDCCQQSCSRSLSVRGA